MKHIPKWTKVNRTTNSHFYNKSRSVQHNNGTAPNTSRVQLPASDIAKTSQDHFSARKGGSVVRGGGRNHGILVKSPPNFLITSPSSLNKTKTDIFKRELN